MADGLAALAPHEICTERAQRQRERLESLALYAERLDEHLLLERGGDWREDFVGALLADHTHADFDGLARGRALLLAGERERPELVGVARLRLLRIEGDLSRWK